MVKPCLKDRQQNCAPQEDAQLHLEVLSAPVHFIVMNMIGTFKLSLQGHQYALMVMDMLIYIQYIPLYTKEADQVVHACLVNVYSKFGKLCKTLSGNGTEF